MVLKWGNKRQGRIRYLVSMVGASLLWLGLGAVLFPGCGPKELQSLEPNTSSVAVETLSQHASSKVDLLLSLDNSRSMADKQELLQLAIPDLVNSLVNPNCVDQEGKPTAQQPAAAAEDCPVDGSHRIFEPIQDIHIGVITSSLGSHGADTCDPSSEPSVNDRAWLIDRKSTSSNEKVPTWNDKGFLAWDPNTNDTVHSPQGETDESRLIERLRQMVGGAGEVGCGFEGQLESWYRFLVEPEPHASITVEGGQAMLQGRDEVLLQQRKDFLRPDSLLLIVMLSDENDCSIRDGGEYFLVAQAQVAGTTEVFHLPRPRAACATNPNSPCCRSCKEAPGDGCDTSMDDCTGNLPSLEDALNVRCFDQKRRFGIDFLYPVERYITGLTSRTIMDRKGNVVPNPIFSVIDPEATGCGGTRDVGSVFLTGIVGVPWQDIARRDSDGKPNLRAGLNMYGRPVGGYQTASEMVGLGTWEIIVGDASKNLKPRDPLMVESIEPRSGSNPVTGDAMQPPSASEGANPINGHEYNIFGRDDLQYACIYPLQEPRDCSNNAICDCGIGQDENPLCDPSNPQIQKYGKAYPGLRELAVIRGLGIQGSVGSICPEQQTDHTANNFGYRPAMGSIVERLTPTLCGGCYPRELATDASGQVSCRVIEARTANTCDCDRQGRVPLTAGGAKAVASVKAQQSYAQANWNCFCEVPQLSGKALLACQNQVGEPVVDSDGTAVHGWCYVDANKNVGNPALVQGCPEGERRDLRLVGAGESRTCGTLLLACSVD
jgi:hypothetical protein